MRNAQKRRYRPGEVVVRAALQRKLSGQIRTTGQTSFQCHSIVKSADTKLAIDATLKDRLRLGLFDKLQGHTQEINQTRLLPRKAVGSLLDPRWLIKTLTSNLFLAFLKNPFLLRSVYFGAHLNICVVLLSETEPNVLG